MRCDLHTHSEFSDGHLTPAELVDAAADQNVDVLALTDHDEVGGLPAARERCARRGVQLLAGVELSVREADDSAQLHLLGLGIDPDHDELANWLGQMRERRAERIHQIVARLALAGVALDVESLDAAADIGSVGRPHVARALVSAGVCRDENEAFRRLLRRGKPAYVPSPGLGAARAIQLVHAAGGIASLAHPPQSRGVDAPGGLEAFVEWLAHLGLDALEVQHPAHTRGQMKRMRRLCRQLELVETGGSDFHGGPGSERVPGRGRGALRFGSRLWRDLSYRLEKYAS